MAGFRLTDGSDGCPPTEAPPASYENPFRFDSAGRLWVTQCFRGFRYFGAARHDIRDDVIIGSATCMPSSAADIVSGTGVAAGTYRNVTVTNDTECTLGILLSLDTIVDMSTYGGNFVGWAISARWNGVNKGSTSQSNPQIIGSTALIRQNSGVSANPFDPGVEAGSAPTITLAPGASGVVSSKMFLRYWGGTPGTPTGTEIVHNASSAVRVYGYII